MVSIGARIKQEFEKQDRTVVWFARQLSCDRTNIYDIFNRENIDLILLKRISKVLKYNFFKEISESMEQELRESVERQTTHL